MKKALPRQRFFCGDRMQPSSCIPCASERRNDSALVLLEDELLHVGRVQRVHQLGDVGIVGTVLARDHDVGVGRIGTFDEQRILGGIELGLDGVVGVDQGQVHVSQRAWQQRGFEFLELELLGVLGHVQRRGGQDRKSTRLNSSHLVISYAVFCLKKKKNQQSHHNTQQQHQHQQDHLQHPPLNQAARPNQYRTINLLTASHLVIASTVVVLDESSI